MLAEKKRSARYDTGDDSDNAIAMQPMQPAAVAGQPAARASGACLVFDSIVQRKLARMNDRLELDRHRLLQIHSQGGNTGQARKELEKSSRALHDLLQVLDPAHLLDKATDDDTRQAYSDYQAAWQSYQAEARNGRRKHLHNLAAGGMGNLLCFGLGGMASVYAGSPLAGLAINTLAWTAAEPLISMLRATTVTNPCLDRYMIRQQRQARALRELLAGNAGRETNKKIPWRAADSNGIEWLSASEWLARTSWISLWAGKRLTDDMIYFVYSAAYSVTGCLPEFLGKALYDMSTWQGRLAYVGIRTAGGMLAGAIIQEGIQLLRASCMEQTGGVEVVTKPRGIWAKEARYVARLLARIDLVRAREDIAPVEKSTLEMLRKSVQLWHDKAVAKSRLTTAIAYEWQVMWQAKREATGIDPEVPGKRLDTIASFIGKGICQLPGIAVSSFAGATATRSSAPWVRWAGYLVPPFATIGLFGFAVRREWEALARAMLGAGQGVYRRSVRCCGGMDEHEGNDT